MTYRFTVGEICFPESRRSRGWGVWELLRESAGRLGRMAAAGNKVAILKLSAILIGIVLVLYYGWKIFV